MMLGEKECCWLPDYNQQYLAVSSERDRNAKSLLKPKARSLSTISQSAMIRTVILPT